MFEAEKIAQDLQNSGVDTPLKNKNIIIENIFVMHLYVTK